MNTYTFTIETVNDTQEFDVEAAKASLNHEEGTILAVMAPGHFKVIKLPEDWTSIEAKETLGEEEQAAYDEAVAAEKAAMEAQAMAAQQQTVSSPGVLPGGQMPVAPVAPIVPPGQ